MAGTLAVPPLLPLLAPLAGCFYTLRLEKRRLEAVLAVLGRKAGEVLGMVPLDAEAAAGAMPAETGLATAAGAALPSRPGPPAEHGIEGAE
jgi:hypothetical protein